MPHYRYAQQQAQRQTQLIAMFRRRPLSFELSAKYQYHMYVTLIPGTQTSPQVALWRYHPPNTRTTGPPYCGLSWSYTPPASTRLPANPPPGPPQPRDMSSIKQVNFPPQQPSLPRLSSPPLALNFISRASSSQRPLPFRSHFPPIQSRNFSTTMVSSVNRTSLHPSGVT